MSGLFSIPLSSLKEGRHVFNFEIGNEFFDQFAESEIREGQLLSVIDLDKRASHIDMRISITGRVKITCDRCLEMFFMPVSCENRILVKPGKEWDSDDPDIIIMSPDDHELDLKQYLYEFIHLALPLQRIHPENADGKSECNPEMIAKMKEHIVNDENIDPRWDELKQLMKD